MASMRRVRRSFRKDALRTITEGDGNIETLVRLAGKHFGHDVGYESLIKSFLSSEVSNALSCLRSDGHVESVGGKKWKVATDLSQEESAVVSHRRWKRLQGELQSEIRFAHSHGLTEEAIKAAKMLSMTAMAEEVAEEPVNV